MGANDFSVGHTGVTARQRAGTLETVVKFDYSRALKKAWDYLAASPRDSEEVKSTSFFFRPPPTSLFFCRANVLILVWVPQV